MPGVVCNAIGPHPAQRLVREPVGSQETAGLVGAVDLEPLRLGAVLVGQAEVVEHRTDVEQLGIRGQAPELTLEHAEEVDAARVVEQQRWGGVAHEIGRLRDHAAVGDGDTSDLFSHETQCRWPSDSTALSVRSDSPGI